MWEGTGYVMYWKQRSIYKFRRTKKGWIVINTKTNNHAHFRSEKGCRTIIALLRKGVEPSNTYLRESYERLR